jgi:hypothetical protein
LSFYEGVGVGVLKVEESESEVLKIEESESEFLCTDSTAVVIAPTILNLGNKRKGTASSADRFTLWEKALSTQRRDGLVGRTVNPDPVETRKVRCF